MEFIAAIKDRWTDAAHWQQVEVLESSLPADPDLELPADLLDPVRQLVERLYPEIPMKRKVPPRPSPVCMDLARWVIGETMTYRYLRESIDAFKASWPDPPPAELHSLEELLDRYTGDPDDPLQDPEVVAAVRDLVENLPTMPMISPIPRPFGLCDLEIWIGPR